MAGISYATGAAFLRDREFISKPCRIGQSWQSVCSWISFASPKDRLGEWMKIAGYITIIDYRLCGPGIVMTHRVPFCAVWVYSRMEVSTWHLQVTLGIWSTWPQCWLAGLAKFGCQYWTWTFWGQLDVCLHKGNGMLHCEFAFDWSSFCCVYRLQRRRSQSHLCRAFRLLCICRSSRLATRQCWMLQGPGFWFDVHLWWI